MQFSKWKKICNLKKATANSVHSGYHKCPLIFKKYKKGACEKKRCPAIIIICKLLLQQEKE
jgi:hypothetical protein